MYGLPLEPIDGQHQVDSLIVAVGHNEFRKLDPAVLRTFCCGSARVLGDDSSLYDRNALGEHG